MLAWGGGLPHFTSTRCCACSVAASHAARLSDVTSQLVSPSGASRSASNGRHSAAAPSRSAVSDAFRFVDQAQRGLQRVHRLRRLRHREHRHVVRSQVVEAEPLLLGAHRVGKATAARHDDHASGAASREHVEPLAQLRRIEQAAAQLHHPHARAPSRAAPRRRRAPRRAPRRALRRHPTASASRWNGTGAASTPRARAQESRRSRRRPTGA